MNWGNRLLGMMLGGLLAGFLFNGTAFAHARSYVWTEQYKTLPQGSFELENWVTFKMPDGTVKNENTIEYQEELEYGITDHWNIAHYEMWKTKNQAGLDASGSPKKDSTTYEGFKFETKYRIGESGKYWLDPLLYLELEDEVREEHRNIKLEGKIVLSKDIDKLNVSYNQVMESELDNGGRTEHEYRLGASYEVFSGARVGVELLGNYWKPSSHRNEVSIGPTLAYEGKYFWVATGVALGANRAADDLEARAIVGITF